MNQQEIPISGLHPQNNRLEVSRAVKKYETDDSGLATTFEGSKKQVKEREDALERATSDRADLDDVPQLSENSQFKIEDLPTTQSDEDLQYFDDEINKKAAELDEAQERLRHFEAIEYIREMIRAQEEYLQHLQEDLQKSQLQREKLLELEVDNDFLDLADRKISEVQMAINEMEAELTGARLILPAFEAGLIDDAYRVKIGEVIRDNPLVLDTQMRDVIVMFNNKSQESQSKDINELIYLRDIRSQGGLDSQEEQDINFEIRAIEISLSKYGIDVRDEAELRRIVGGEEPKEPVKKKEKPEINEAEELVAEVNEQLIDIVTEANEIVTLPDDEEPAKVVASFRQRMNDIEARLASAQGLNEVQAGELETNFDAAGAAIIELEERFATLSEAVVEEEADGEPVIEPAGEDNELDAPVIEQDNDEEDEEPEPNIEVQVQQNPRRWSFSRSLRTMWGMATDWNYRENEAERRRIEAAENTPSEDFFPIQTELIAIQTVLTGVELTPEEDDIPEELSTQYDDLDERIEALEQSVTDGELKDEEREELLADIAEIKRRKEERDLSIDDEEDVAEAAGEDEALTGDDLFNLYSDTGDKE
jgi:hypothetical protein